MSDYFIVFNTVLVFLHANRKQNQLYFSFLDCVLKLNAIRLSSGKCKNVKVLSRTRYGTKNILFLSLLSVTSVVHLTGGRARCTAQAAASGVASEGP